jgi:hypothetical protein
LTIKQENTQIRLPEIQSKNWKKKKKQCATVTYNNHLCSSREKARNPFFSIYFFSWTVKNKEERVKL